MIESASGGKTQLLSSQWCIPTARHGHGEGSRMANAKSMCFLPSTNVFVLMDLLLPGQLAAPPQEAPGHGAE